PRFQRQRLDREIAIALLTAKEIFDLVRDDLLLVEEELARQSEAAFPPVSEITAYLLGGGGKRMRPALLLLSARYAGRKDSSAIRLRAVRRTRVSTRRRFAGFHGVRGTTWQTRS